MLLWSLLGCEGPEVAVAQNGAFVAVAEGAWHSSHLVVRPLP